MRENLASKSGTTKNQFYLGDEVKKIAEITGNFGNMFEKN